MDLEQESTENQDTGDIKEAIIDLYLAIKIRSTEELDKIIDTQRKITEYTKSQNRKKLYQIVIIVDDFADDPSVFSKQ